MFHLQKSTSVIVTVSCKRTCSSTLYGFPLKCNWYQSRDPILLSWVHSTSFTQGISYPLNTLQKSETRLKKKFIYLFYLARWLFLFLCMEPKSGVLPVLKIWKDYHWKSKEILSSETTNSERCGIQWTSQVSLRKEWAIQFCVKISTGAIICTWIWVIILMDLVGQIAWILLLTT